MQSTVRCRIAIALILVLTFCPRSALAWGRGHDSIARAVFDRLPQALRASLPPPVVKRAIEKDSHYPDSMEPFSGHEIGQAALDRLHAVAMKKRHDLHSDAGRAMAFALLVDALRGKQYEHAAFWIAAMSHSVADMAACNHDPLVHTATYEWSEWDLKLPDGPAFRPVNAWLDLHATAGNAAGARAIEQAIEKMTLHDDGRSAEQAMAEIMAYGQEGARFCAPRGVPILAAASAWSAARDTAARDKLFGNMAELGAWAVVRTVRDVEAAIRLAEARQPLEITPRVRAAFQQRVDLLLRERRLDEDALFTPILRDIPAHSGPAVGVVLEPTWRMNEGMLGFSSRVLAASIARTLIRSGRPHVTLDVRALLADGFPSPDRMPVVILVATSFSSYQGWKAADLDGRIAAYLKDGGRIVWVAGTARIPAGSLETISQAMKKEDKQTLPLEESRFVGSRLELRTPGSEASWRIARSPQTAAGWQRALCPWRFELEGHADLQPLLTLASPDASIVVGAITADGRIACLPVYALSPYLLEGTDRLASPSEPCLDPAGTAILLAVLKRMH